jgi:predicted DsbA family dithiol-disulfide isomerase
LGVEIRLPAVSPQPYTRLAFQGLEFAKDQNQGSEYNGRVMRAFFQESRDIGNLDVLTELATEVGLDADEFRREANSPHYAVRVAALLRHACEELGITGIPYFVIGAQRLTGLQSREALAAAIERAGKE